jgi:uncharacterized membrane protein YhhN
VPRVELALALLCAAFVVKLLYAEATGRRTLKRVSKTLASCCFVGVAVVRAWTMPGTILDACLLLGLCLGAAGDVALTLDGQRAFLLGLGAFLLGHLAYAIGFATLVPGTAWADTRVAVAAVAMVAAGGAMLRHLRGRLGPMRIPVIVYVAVIGAMVVTAVAASDARIVAGAVLFAVSDVAVAQERFVKDSFSNKVWGLPLYYAAQLCLAFAVGTAR